MVSYWLFQDNPINNINRFVLQEMGIILEAIIGVCYFTIFSVCLVSVSKADSIFFTPSFDYADLVIAMVCEASKGLD